MRAKRERWGAGCGAVCRVALMVSALLMFISGMRSFLGPLGYNAPNTYYPESVVGMPMFGAADVAFSRTLLQRLSPDSAARIRLVLTHPAGSQRLRYVEGQLRYLEYPRRIQVLAAEEDWMPDGEVDLLLLSERIAPPAGWESKARFRTLVALAPRTQ